MKKVLGFVLAFLMLCICAADPARAADELIPVRCDEQGFSLRIPADKTAYWEENVGLRVSVDTPGYVPYIAVYRRPEKLKNPVNYLNNVYREYMEGRYDNNVGTNPCVNYDIGGKTLYAASYHYAVSGNKLVLTLMVEVRDDGDVEYFAKYVEGKGDATLAVLDTVVRYYQPDAEGSTLQAPAVPQTVAKELYATAAQPIVACTIQYNEGRFSMKLPEGWQIMTQSEFMTFCFKAWDPRNPNRTIFMFMKLEPLLKSWEAKKTYQTVNDSLGGSSIYALSADAPVMESCTLQGFLDSIPQIYDFCSKYFDAGLTISPSVLPQMKNVTIVEKTRSALPAPDTCGENVIGRIAFEDYLGQRCEGLVTAQPVNTMQYDFFGVDGWPYTVYLFMGVTAPMGEMPELETPLIECLGSFSFAQSYVNQAVNISTSETQALLAQGRTMQAAHDAMVDAWYAREKSHDIAFQKWSDSFMGYDRLYDSATGEIYLADVGFYDSYDLHRGEYSNANLRLVDSSTEQYYLQRPDYYITK